MNNINKQGRQLILFVSALLMLVQITSCSSLIKDDEGDCEPRYKLSFYYDYNMKYADAFSSEVNKVNLYIFDEAGVLVREETFEGNQLPSRGNEYDIRLQPGNYHFVAWGTDKENFSDYVLPTMIPGKSKIEELDCFMKRDRSQEVKQIGMLYYGSLEKELIDYELDKPSTDYSAYQHIAIPMIKNTNLVKVVLQCLSSDKDMKAKDYKATITDNNGWYDYSDKLKDDVMLTYRPYYEEVSLHDAVYNGNSYDQMPALVAEFSINRLFATHKDARLTVANNEGKTIFSIPLIDYMLLVKGHYGKSVMSDQEYLDRQDDYDFVFFLNGDKWLASQVIINSYRVVLQDVDL